MKKFSALRGMTIKTRDLYGSKSLAKALLLNLFLCASALCCSAPEKAFTTIRIKSTRPFHEFTCGGSGVLIDKKQGLFLTNAHVVGERPFDQLSVEYAKGAFADLNVIASDLSSDIAIVQCDPSKIQDMEEAPLAKKAAVPGMRLRAISNDSASRHGKVVVKDGVFCGEAILSQTMGSFIPEYAVFVYASGGCSGSPVFNELNEIQGITNGGDCFTKNCIPLHRVRYFVDCVRRHLKDPKQPINGRILLGYGVCGSAVLDMKNVVKNHPALEKEGRVLLVYREIPQEGGERTLRTGDVILSVNGKKMHGSERSFDEEVIGSRVLNCEVLRGGSVINVRVGVTEYDPNAGEMYTYGPLVFSAIGKPDAAELPVGSVVNATYQPGEVVFYVNGQSVSNMREFMQAIALRGWRPMCVGSGIQQGNPGKQISLVDVDMPPAYRVAYHCTFKGPLSQIKNVNFGGVA